MRCFQCPWELSGQAGTKLEDSQAPWSIKAVGGAPLGPPPDLKRAGEVRGRAGIMAALCRSHAGTAGRRFLKARVFIKPLRNASTEGGSESSIQDSSAPRARSGGFASALERHSALQRKAGLGLVSRPRGATSGRGAERGEGLRGSRRSPVCVGQGYGGDTREGPAWVGVKFCPC